MIKFLFYLIVSSFFSELYNSKTLSLISGKYLSNSFIYFSMSKFEIDETDNNGCFLYLLDNLFLFVYRNALENYEVLIIFDIFLSS